MTGTRRDLLLLAIAAAVLFVPWLGARDLWNPNEPLYGQAVAEMAARGDWLIPTVNGAVFDEKPILYFWLALAAARATGGVSELALRLPSAISGVACVLLTYLLAMPYVGRRRARLSGLLLATAFVVFWSARQVQMDLLLTACALAAVLGATRAIDGLWRHGPAWMLAGVAAGLGFLAKGPVAVIVPAMVVTSYAVFSSRARELARPGLGAGVLVFVVVASPWYLMLASRGEHAFLSELLVRQNLLRFIEPWDHQAPWWYYLRYFWIDMAPWSWFVPLAWGLAPADDGQRRLGRLSWLWILTVVGFFSLSASKRSPYILPVAPAVAFLAATVLDRERSGSPVLARPVAVRVVLGLLAALFLAAAVALPAGAPWVEDPSAAIGRATFVMAAALGGGGLVILGGLLASRRRPELASAGALVAVAILYLSAAGSALPAADEFKSHRPLCEAVVTHVDPDDRLYGFFDWRWRAGYSFYIGRPIPNLASLEELRERWRGDARVFVIVERGRLEEARRVLGSITPLETRAVGNNTAYLFSNESVVYGQ